VLRLPDAWGYLIDPVPVHLTARGTLQPESQAYAGD